MLWLIRGKVVASRLREAEDRSAQVVRAAEKEASTQAREAQLEAKDMIVQAKAELDKEMQGQRNEILALEKRLIQKRSPWTAGCPIPTVASPSSRNERRRWRPWRRPWRKKRQRWPAWPRSAPRRSNTPRA